MLKFAGAPTFAEMATKYFQVVTSYTYILISIGLISFLISIGIAPLKPDEDKGEAKQAV